MTPWIQGWQGGLFLGSALTLGIDFAIRTWRYRQRYGRFANKQCARCKGDLDEDGRGVGALEKLCICRDCGDTRPVEFANAGDILLSDAAARNQHAADTARNEE